MSGFEAVSLKLTLKELQLIQRLIGHHSCGGHFDYLYNKIYNLAKDAGVNSHEPLPLRRPNTDHYEGRITFALSTDDWMDSDKT